MKGIAKTKIETPTCKTCVCFRPNSETGVVNDVSKIEGTCRFEPPKIIMIPQPGAISINGMFPPIDSNQWCAEWSDKLDLDDLEE